MPRPTTRLTNCCVPQPVTASTGSTDKVSSTDGVPPRADRASHSLRQLRIQSSSSSDTTTTSGGDGASFCLVELGHTKVQCRVLAPTDLVPSHVPLSVEHGVLHVQVKYAAQISYPVHSYMACTATTTDTANNTNRQFTSWLMTRETELASQLQTALAAAVPLEPYPKSAILVQITVLQDDGSVLSACVTAATVALCQARVTLLDTVTACSVAVVNEQQSSKHGTTPKTAWWADPSLDEILYQSKAVVTIGWLPNSKEVTLWEQGGLLTPQETNEAMNLARDGCRTLHRFVREHLLAEFEKEEQQNAKE